MATILRGYDINNQIIAEGITNTPVTLALRYDQNAEQTIGYFYVSDLKLDQQGYNALLWSLSFKTLAYFKIILNDNQEYDVSSLYIKSASITFSNGGFSVYADLYVTPDAVEQFEQFKSQFDQR